MNFSNNEISEIYCLENISNVEVLDLSNNKIVLCERFYDCMARFINLKSLNISSNNLANYDVNLDIFAELKILEELSLAGNEFKSIKFGFFSFLKNLKFLDLSDNKMEHLNPEIFYSLEKLTTLDLRNNPIRTVSTFSAITTYAPYLRILGIENFNFSCECFVQLMVKIRGITLMESKQKITKESNVDGYRCNEVSSWIYNCFS